MPKTLGITRYLRMLACTWWWWYFIFNFFVTNLQVLVYSMCFYVFSKLFHVTPIWHPYIWRFFHTHTQTSEAHGNEAVGFETQPHHLCVSRLPEARACFFVVVFYWGGGMDGLDSKDSKSGTNKELLIWFDLEILCNWGAGFVLIPPPPQKKRCQKYPGAAWGCISFD